MIPEFVPLSIKHLICDSKLHVEMVVARNGVDSFHTRRLGVQSSIPFHLLNGGLF